MHDEKRQDKATLVAEDTVKDMSTESKDTPGQEVVKL